MNLQDYSGKRLISLDIGLKRIGIAKSDVMHIIVTPIGYYERRTIDADIQFILQIVHENNAAAVVAGIPLFKNTDTRTLTMIQDFIEKLRLILNIPVHEHDEWGSSKKARQLMVQSGVKKSNRSAKGKKDEVAACVILQDFLDCYSAS